MTAADDKFKTFTNIWAAFRKPGQLVPSWKNVKPMQFGELLSDVTMVKKYGPRDYRYHLLGSVVNLKMGADPVGEPFLKFVPGHLHDYAYEWLETVASTPCAAWHEMSLEFERGVRRYEALNLPIVGNDGLIDTFLYYNKGWRPEPGENLGRMISSGAQLFNIQPVDIGAGLPDSLPMRHASGL
jgi:hypothetical protein